MYGLDCCYYYTALSLSWDAMFKNTRVELELITDLESYLFIESGGIPLISHRRGHRIFLVISLRTGFF